MNGNLDRVHTLEMHIQFRYLDEQGFAGLCIELDGVLHFIHSVR
jgi:hypothetical protein